MRGKHAVEKCRNEPANMAAPKSNQNAVEVTASGHFDFAVAILVGTFGGERRSGVRETSSRVKADPSNADRGRSEICNVFSAASVGRLAVTRRRRAAEETLPAAP
jgi:hypothetical protein